MKQNKKPIKIKEDVSPDAGLGVAEPMVAPVDSNASLDKILSVMPEFQQFLDGVGRFVDATCPVDPTQSMVNEPPATDTDVVVTDDPVTEATTSEKCNESESTFIKNLGKRYARLGKLCR